MARTDRVVIRGRGGAGKSVLAGRVATAIAAPVVELDALFWARGCRHPRAHCDAAGVPDPRATARWLERIGP